MRRNIIFIILFFCLLGGVFVYLEIENRDFVENLPEPPSMRIKDTSDRSFPATRDMPPDTRMSSFTTETNEQNDSESVVIDDSNTQQDTSERGPDNFDWRDDEYPNTQVIRDPWAVEEASTPLIINPEEMTPEELSEAVHALRIKKFGDIPEVHTLTEIELKYLKRIRTTVDEDIAYFEAAFHLFPSKEIEHSLELAKFKKAKGPNFNIDGKDIEALRELGIKIERSGNQLVVNPPPTP